MIYIENFAIRPYKITLARPFSVGNDTLSQREGVLVEVVGRDGHVGQGEAAPLPGASREPLKKAVHQLKCLERDWAKRSLPDTSRALCSRLEKDLDRSVLAPSVIFALESAFISLAAATGGVSVAAFLGGSSPKAVRSACLLQGDVKTVRAYGAKYAADGFSVFELKVGSRNIPLDVQKVEALKEVIGFDARIRLDADAAWSLDEAVAFASMIGKGQIDFIEGPCAEQDKYEKFFRRTDVPWAISVHTSQRPLEDWEGVQGLRAMVVKPMLSGGVTGFLTIKDIAFQAGAHVVVSSSFESLAGSKMLANLAALTDGPCGLGAVDWLGPDTSALLGRGGIIMPSRL